MLRVRESVRFIGTCLFNAFTILVVSIGFMIVFFSGFVALYLIMWYLTVTK